MTGELDLAADAATLAKRAADDALRQPRDIRLSHEERKQLADLVHKEIVRLEQEARSARRGAMRGDFERRAARLRRNIYDRLVN